MLLSLDNLVRYLDTIYSYLMKPTIQLLFRLYYRRSIRGKLEHANQDILFYSASFLAKQIRDKQVYIPKQCSYIIGLGYESNF